MWFRDVKQESRDLKSNWSDSKMALYSAQQSPYIGQCVLERWEVSVTLD